MLISITSCTSILFTYLISYKILKEKIGKSDIVTIVLLSAGTTLALVFANFEEKTYNIYTIGARFEALESVLFLSIYMGLTILCLIFSHCIIKGIMAEF